MRAGFIVCLCGLLWPLAASAAERPIALELNKLEPAGKGCRMFFVAENPTKDVLQSLKLDLIFFGPDGVIAQRLVIEFGPLPAAKKRVKTFDLEGLGCAAIGSVLLNDLLECRTPAGPVGECLQHLEVSSRAKALFSK